MIEWEKMSNFAAGNKSYSASTTPLGTYSDSSKTRTRQVRSTSAFYVKFQVNFCF